MFKLSVDKKSIGGKTVQEKNVVMNTYWSDNERFADIVNVALFQAKKLILADQLEEIDGCESTMVGEKNRQKKGVQKYRDVVKKATDKVNFMILGIENQSDIHYAMPLKVMGYDYLGYDKQLRKLKAKHRKERDLSGAEFISGFSRTDKLLPICTLVIYSGEEPWIGPTRLSDILDLNDLPEEMRRVVADYPIHVVDMRRFKDSEKLQTDARLLFGVLQRQGSESEMQAYRKENAYAFKNVSEDTYEAIGALTHSEQFLELKETSKNEKGGYNMCKAFDDMEKSAERRGEKRGEKRAEAKIMALIQSMTANGELENIPRLTTDKAFYEEMLQKYAPVF